MLSITALAILSSLVSGQNWNEYQRITTHPYEELKSYHGAAIDNGPPWCGMRYTALNAARIVAVNGMDTWMCNQCLEVQPQNGGKSVYVLAVDRKGDPGLDIATSSLKEMYPNANYLDPQVCKWRIVDHAYCSGVCFGTQGECGVGSRNLLPYYLLPPVNSGGSQPAAANPSGSIPMYNDCQAGSNCASGSRCCVGKSDVWSGKTTCRPDSDCSADSPSTPSTPSNNNAVPMWNDCNTNSVCASGSKCCVGKNDVWSGKTTCRPDADCSSDSPNPSPPSSDTVPMWNDCTVSSKCAGNSRCCVGLGDVLSGKTTCRPDYDCSSSSGSSQSESTVSMWNDCTASSTCAGNSKCCVGLGDVLSGKTTCRPDYDCSPGTTIGSSKAVTGASALESSAMSAKAITSLLLVLALVF